jgi:NAD(P)-dependent dehydrogenase (short-subunit alcohol dehydrogenase family)
MASMEGQVALVTGGARGIGLAISTQLASRGVRVAVGYSHGADTAKQFAAAHEGATIHQGNIGVAADCERVIEEVLEQHGQLDILINNAGITRDKMFHNLDDDLFDLVLDVNLKTVVHATQAAMPHMRDVAKAELKATGKVAYQRKIVNTSSSVAFTGNPGQANYTAAKGAIISLTRTLARELGPFGITVNAVAPGFIETRLTAPKGDGDELGVPEQMRQMAIAITALGRAGRPEDVAAVHAFLAGPDSDFVTGVTIPVTGGQLGVM